MILATHAGYEVDDDPERLDLDVIIGFLLTTYWGKHRSRETFERALRRSVGVGLYAPGGAQAGFARVVGDGATFAWLADVFVLPEHRGKGLARVLVSAVLEHPDHAEIERWLLATADAHGVYAPLGFGPIEALDKFMIRSGPTASSLIR
ncbi:GNAT family N-acetyltransferase [Jiangella muralis]|uniref:GNAT family N-acetyltransferase n=1 Tax=Jiangella muralis TaxID=702383 RepID=UPI00069F54DC|nr:GNAT family N-acetyltransferase [Jiangella muralis]